MSQSNDRRTGLLNELDDIRSLLEDPQADERIPVLEDAVDGPDAAIPRLDDAISPDPAPLAPDADRFESSAEHAFDTEDFRAFTRAPVVPAWEDFDVAAPAPTATHATDGCTITERMVRQGLEAALRARVDAALEHFINETLQVELALLRARLQEAIRTEIESFVSREIHRSIDTGNTHGE